MASNQQDSASVEAIKQSLSGDELTSAEEAGVDIDEVIRDNLTMHGDYSTQTIVRFVKNDIQDAIEAEKADTIAGIIMGCRDRFGANWPRRWSLVRSSGDHLQFSTWDRKLDGPGGGEMDIPLGGAVVELRASYDEQYDSWEGKRVEKFREMDHNELIDGLSQVAVGPTELSRGDEHETVVVMGTIAYVNPQTVFAGEDQDDWYDGAVLMENERGEVIPHLEFSLNTGGDEYRVRGHFDRQAHAHPFIQVPDLEKLCHDAVRRHDGSPESQARFVQNGLRGEQVIIVGNVNSFNVDRDDGDVVHYIDIGVSGLVSTDSTQQLDIEEASQVDETEEESVVDESPETEPEVTEQVAEVRGMIETYCQATGTDIESLTLEDVRENMGGIDAPDVAIRQALGGAGEPADEPADEPAGDDEGGPEDVHGYDDLPFKPGEHTVPEIRDLLEDVDDKETLVNLSSAEKAGDDRKTAKEAINNRADELAEGDSESDDSDDTDDPFEAIYDDESGQYHCPGQDDGDDCLASAGSTGELTAHIVDVHGVVDQSPKEWVESQVGA